MKWNLVVAVVLAIAALGLTAVQPARANGVPLLVDLTYLTRLSNWGPKEASGTLELDRVTKATARDVELGAEARWEGRLRVDVVEPHYRIVRLDAATNHES